ncbi:zinc finger protein GAI-ASSOCIATED FACTOR 1-like [Humulus lupulus]|uniref:zinc finger protein GAI-ASSOCIATED FACTOR 1-like n=1 Tax=Humulus lupulus TaxID=3486 RepID=UPI002B409292|nr:zinc finger protein GAI-ASSOCIATED FACTOR 1-like [Humulus lupulus]
MSIITGSGDHGGRSLSSGNFGRESSGVVGGGVEKEEVLENLNNNNNGSNSFSSTTTSNGSSTHQVLEQPSQQAKKKRNPPGNPDPSAEVIALSPNTLLARNRFVCEICSKGFQRDQNLQLHRRGHNLPWKLRQRSPNEVVRKRVYICPETSCVHHNPTRALGDLTGIKKHFCRKHGEKKWKCEKCSKKYAVQSDWKAHSKTCGTREYKCECGTIFSRRDSFITHRAFCDAIAEENNKTTSLQRQNISSSTQPELVSSIISTINDENDNKYANLQAETTSSDQFKHMMMNMKNPLILDHHHHQSLNNSAMAPGGSFFSRSSLNNMIINNGSTTTTNISSSAPLSFDHHHSQNNDHHFGGGGEFYLSATALLQKAAQMGATTVSSASSAMAPSTYASLDHQLFAKKDHPLLQEYQMNSTSTTATTTTATPPPQFFNVNGNHHNNDIDNNNNNKNVGLFSGLLFDHQNHAAGGGGGDSTFMKEMELSMNNDNASNVVLHGGNSSSSLTTTGGGDVMTVDFLGIGSRPISRQGNFHHDQQKKQVVDVVNNLRFGGGINGSHHPSMQTTLTQFQQHAALMEKHAWEV